MDKQPSILAETLKPWPFVAPPEDVEVHHFISDSGKGEMAEMNHTGDKKTVWDSRNPDEVEAARREFEYLVTEKKYAAFAVGKDGEKTEPIRQFNANLEKIIYVKANQGG